MEDGLAMSSRLLRSAAESVRVMLEPRLAFLMKLEVRFMTSFLRSYDTYDRMGVSMSDELTTGYRQKMYGTVSSIPFSKIL
jgi:hypothetical protein